MRAFSKFSYRSQQAEIRKLKRKLKEAKRQIQKCSPDSVLQNLEGKRRSPPPEVSQMRHLVRPITLHYFDGELAKKAPHFYHKKITYDSETGSPREQIYSTLDLTQFRPLAVPILHEICGRNFHLKNRMTEVYEAMLFVVRERRKNQAQRLRHGITPMPLQFQEKMYGIQGYDCEVSGKRKLYFGRQPPKKRLRFRYFKPIRVQTHLRFSPTRFFTNFTGRPVRKGHSQTLNFSPPTRPMNMMGLQGTYAAPPS